ncbi:MAG: carboxypeptidase regulatory-like domain-containing protein, partial [Bacteroidota bacterium]
MKRYTEHWLLTSLWVALLTGLVATSVYAQTATLRGTVTDAETGEPLPGANITVTTAVEEERPRGTASGFGGAFEVRGLSAGTYTVTVSYVGYTKEVIADVELSDGEVKTLNVALSTTGIQFNPISVTASRRPERLLEAPAAVSVLDARQIAERPSLSVSDHLA